MPPDDALDRGGATGSFARLGRDPGPEKWRRWRVQRAESSPLILPSPSPLASCSLPGRVDTCYLHQSRQQVFASQIPPILELQQVFALLLPYAMYDASRTIRYYKFQVSDHSSDLNFK